MRDEILSVFSVLVIFLIAGCTPRAATASSTGEPAEESAQSIILNVFAAASLTESLTEIGAQFEARNPGITIVFNFAGSQQLAQQINEGAPVDVFASANQTQMNTAIEGGRIATDSPQTFVTNRLVVIFPVDNPADLSTLQDLSKPGLRLILAAAEVPVGQYSVQFLDKAMEDTAFGMTFKDDVLSNVVSYENNVKIVLTKVALGEADAGIVYASDVTGENAARVGQLDVPDALNVLASYPIAQVTDSSNANYASLFVSYVLSPEGQKTLGKYGFMPVIDIE